MSSPAADGSAAPRRGNPGRRAKGWRLYGVVVDGATVFTLASDDPVSSADVAAVLGVPARDVTVCSLDKVTVTMPGEVDKVTVAVDLSRD